MTRPRSFVWVERNGLRFPQIIFNDPRVGCERLPIVKGTERKLEPSDTRSLNQLAADYPAPSEAP